MICALPRTKEPAPRVSQSILPTGLKLWVVGTVAGYRCATFVTQKDPVSYASL